MADGVNWGILQPLEQSAPIRSASPQAQSNSAPSPNPNDGMQGIAQGAQVANDRARLGLLQQENARQQQLLPGQLQNQQITNQGGILDNQVKQATLAKAQYEVQKRQALSEAYINGKNKGGPDGGLDAMQDKAIEMGDPETALGMQKTREDIKKAEIENGVAGTVAIGNAVAGLMAGEAPTTDPSTGKQIPGTPALQAYTQQYPTFKKLYPDAPDPSTFKTNAQFHDTFATPVLAVAGPKAKQMQADMEATKDNKLYQAQQTVKSAQADLQNKIKTLGPNDSQTKQAANNLLQAQQDAAREASGNGYLQGVGAAYKQIAPTWAGGSPNADQTIEENSGKSQPTSPTGSAQGSLGNQTSSSNQPSTNSITPEMAQQELARRAAARQSQGNQ